MLGVVVVVVVVVLLARRGDEGATNEATCCGQLNIRTASPLHIRTNDDETFILAAEEGALLVL
jgi:hypothetical protein